MGDNCVVERLRSFALLFEDVERESNTVGGTPDVAEIKLYEDVMGG